MIRSSACGRWPGWCAPAGAWWCSSSASPQGLFGGLFRFYSKVIMPFVGGLLTGNKAAYEYLPRTSAAFPAGERFLELMDRSGSYKERVAHSLTFGTSYVYVGTVR